MARAEVLQVVQRLVGPAEETVPAAGVGLFRQVIVEGGAPRRKQRVEAVFGRQRAARAAGREQRDRHQRRARPLREIVDREREPERKPDHLGRQVGRLVPWPFADEREPVAGEHADVSQAALGLDPQPGFRQRRLVVFAAERAQGGVGLDGGVDIAVGRVVVDLPSPVGALGFAKRRAKTGAQGVVFQTQEPQRQAPLRLHAGVGVGARDPMAVGLLVGNEPIGGGAGAGGERGVEIIGGGHGVHGGRGMPDRARRGKRRNSCARRSLPRRTRRPPHRHRRREREPMNVGYRYPCKIPSIVHL